MNRIKGNRVLQTLAFLLLPVALIILFIAYFSIADLYNNGYREGEKYEDSLLYHTALVSEANSIGKALSPETLISNGFNELDLSYTETPIDTSPRLIKSNPKYATELVTNDMINSSSLWFWFWPAKDHVPYTNKADVDLNSQNTADFLKHFDYVYDLKNNGFITMPDTAYLSYLGGSVLSDGLIAFSVKEVLPNSGLVWQNAEVYQEAAEFSHFLYPTLAFSIIAALLLLIYLIYSAAYENRRNAQGVVQVKGPELISLDRFPLDLLIFLAILFFLLCALLFTWQIATQISFSSYVYRNTITVDLFFIHRFLRIWPLATLMYPGIFALQYAMLSLIRHFKCGTLGQSLLLFKLIKKAKNLILTLTHKVYAFFAMFVGSSSRPGLLRLLALYLFSGMIGLLITLMFGSLAVFLAAVFLSFFLPTLYVFYRQWRNLKALDYLNKQLEELKSGHFENNAIQNDTDVLPQEYANLSADLGAIRQLIKAAVERESRNERLKTELLTNVSHDLRTPLTAVISYIDLLKNEPVASEKAAEYLRILENKSARLRQLTEDLIDASKALSGNLSCNVEEINLTELLHQQIGEYSERMKNKSLDVILRLPETEQALRLYSDPRHLARILDNLFSNIEKYALAGSRVYVSLHILEDAYRIELKNVSAVKLDKDMDELFERFVRGDSARSEGGSGLGLSIARSLADCIAAELSIKLDDDLFVATLTVPFNKD